MRVTAAPGIAIVELVETTQTDIILPEQKGRVKRGRILHMGSDIRTDYGQYLLAKEYGKVGDVIYFLHYYEAEGLDYTQASGKQIFFVKWSDFRGKEE